MDRRTSAVLSLHTGVLVGPWGALHAYAQELAGRPVWTHELADPALVDRLKDLGHAEFERICRDAAALPPEPWEHQSFTDEQMHTGLATAVASLPVERVVVVAVDDPERSR